MEFEPRHAEQPRLTPEARDWRTSHVVMSGSLTYQQVQIQSTGLLYSRYHLWVKDMTSNRMVPHHIGETERSCSHQACELVLANAMVAGYVVEQGWANDHSAELARGMLSEAGWHQP